MANTWKERGIVPDSDEEDDTVDSQSTLNSEKYGDLDGILDVLPAILAVGVGREELQGESLPIQKTSSLSVYSDRTEYQEANCVTNKISQELVYGELLSDISPRTHAHAQSDTTSKRFVDLDTRENNHPQSSSEHGAVTQAGASCLEGAAEDEVSRSYVGLSSPTSSLSSLSSLFPTSRQSSPGAGIQPTGNDDQIEPANLVQIPPVDEITRHEVSVFNNMNNYEPPKRRSFRPRTQIQLHPYLLDSERHRREFMARGLQPMRFTQAQQIAQNAPQDGDSQDTEFEAEDDSQNTGFEVVQGVANISRDLLSSPTSSPRPYSEIDNRQRSISSNPGSVGLSIEEDEFPDIDDLVEQARKGSFGAKRAGNIDYKRTYRKVCPRPKKSPLASNRSKFTAPTFLNVFDEIQSPPLTSPSLQLSANWVGDMQETSSRQGSEEPPTRLGDAQMDARVMELPTPATSSAKRIYEHSTEIYGDDETLFTSSNVAEELQSSPPKGPDKARKTFRGMLPESHIRIDSRTKVPQPNAPRTTAQDSFNHLVTPDVRRGIALPRRTDEVTTFPRLDPRSGLCFLSDDSDEGDFGIQGVVTESGEDSQRILSQSDFGFAIEDDRIDPMVTSKKRQRSLFTHTGIKKKSRRIPPIFKSTYGGPSYQPRIAEAFSDSHRTPLYTERNAFNQNNPPSLAQEISKKIRSRLNPQQLNIQEAMPQFNEPLTYQPKFIRIAARSAGSRHSLARHGPAKKFVRLDNRDDTIDAQTTLRLWRGKRTKHRSPTQSSRLPLHSISENSKIQTSLSTNNFKEPVRSHIKFSRTYDHAEVLVTNHQTKISWASMNPIVDSNVRSRSNSRRRAYTKFPTSRRTPLTNSTQQPRSAQLEISEADYGNRDRRSAFGSSKRNLDKTYKRYQNGSSTENHIPLARFLAGKDLISNSTDASSSPFRNSDQNTTMIYDVDHDHPKARRQRKRTPKQMDATAARYRQPDKPSIIASNDRTTSFETIQATDGMLYGLDGADACYSIDFDVFPLRSGVYFHESTFIGKGKLAKSLRIESSPYHEHPRGYASAQFGTHCVRWGMWDATVSLEIGICFDWIVNRLNVFVSSSLDTVKSDVDKDVVRCMLFMVDYFQDTLTFQNYDEPDACLLRMTEVMEGLTQCLEVLPNNLDSEDDLNNRRIMDLSIFEVVLIFQTLRIAATHGRNVSQHTTNQLETLLQRAAITSVKLLFIVGLSSVQSLYDGLQYLAIREAGIRSCESPTQAWVLLMHIMHAARIPRVSFWDAVNLQLLGNISIESDARVLEKTWYSMLSLLPLMEFDELGVLAPRSRYRATSENWAIPQKISKRLFELYTSNPKQPQNFNKYCRTIFSRCHHLIQVWGWHRYGPIVGTFFDFFASHGFSHIGGEIFYTSPEFLQDLNGALSSAIQPEDQCFHIFLKIIHSAIRQLSEVPDAKEIRNLVTRLLPNHDLEYQTGSTKATNIGSLQNHHDLLSTLFWAAPSELRHKISIMLELVVQERSKRETHLRNARHQKAMMLE